MSRKSAFKELISKASQWNKGILTTAVGSTPISSVTSKNVDAQNDPFRRYGVSKHFWNHFEDQPSIHEQSVWAQRKSGKEEEEENKENIDPKKSKMADEKGVVKGLDLEAIWASFGRETSCHGIKSIGDPKRSKFWRAMWAVVVLGMAFLLMMSIVNLFIEYQEHRTVTRSDVRIQVNPVFPSVTFCNICPFKNPDGDPNSILNRISAQTTAFSGYFPLNLSDPGMQSWLNTSVIEIANNYSFSKEEMLSYAQYEGNYLNIAKAFEITKTPFGRCYTFNGPEYISKHGVRRVNFDGRHSGLRVFIKVDQKRYTIYDDLTAGIRMFLSVHPETPRQHKDGIDIHPGTSTKVVLNPVQYKFLPRPFPSYGSEDCLDSHERYLRDKMMTGHFYSRNMCIDQCHNKVASHHCSCHGYMLAIEGLPPCTLNQYINCHALVMDAIRQGILNVTCDCPRLCTFTRFDTIMFASQMPSAASSEFIMKRVNESSVQKLRENYVEVRIYLGTLLIRLESHEPQYTLHSIFAFLGGQMGFFLGASLITLAEVAEAIYVSLRYLITRKLPNCGKMKETKLHPFLAD